jgi:hypothetical protein
MKKIMFNKHLGLQQSVLDGTKNMTRRIIQAPRKFKGVEDTMLEFNRRIGASIFYDCVVCDGGGHELGQMPLPYEVGEVVAIAQAYKEIIALVSSTITPHSHDWMREEKGWDNKMLVKARYMQHQIQITDLWFERLQDISDEDIMREGIHEGEFMNTWDRFYYDMWGDVANHITFRTPREAFASLIDRVSGRGTWESNPWVVAYSFNLIK